MIGDTIRTARKRLGLTQKELAERWGTTHNTISRWELGLVTPECPGMVLDALKGIELAREVEFSPEQIAEIEELQRKAAAADTRTRAILDRMKQGEVRV